MSNLAIIPARGGSKRIPGKNIKDFLGKPIISYSIEAAHNSKLFDEIMVSTDNSQIAEIAKNLGAKVPFLRSAETSDEYATFADVIEEVKKEYLKINRRFDYICCILPTAPLITVRNIEFGFRFLKKTNADSVKPVIRYSYPIQRAFKLHDDKVVMFHPELHPARSQDLEPTFHDAGQLYWMKFESGLIKKNKFGFEISEMEGQDIDTLEDWKLAEFKYIFNNRKSDI